MMKGDHGQTNHINWGALGHASRAPQLMSCNYYSIHVYMCVCVCITNNEPWSKGLIIVPPALVITVAVPP